MTLFISSFVFANLLNDDEASNIALGIIFNFTIFIVVVALVYSFHKIKKMTQKLIDIFKNENTMYLQLAFFIAALTS